MENVIEVLGTQLTDEQLNAIIKKRADEKKKALEEKRQSYEALREQIVIGAVNSALLMQDMLMKGHNDMISDMLTFRVMMQEFGDLRKNSLGGFTLKSENDTMKVSLKIRNLGEFDERADIAEGHITDFFERTLKKADPNSFDMLMSLLERKKGKLEYSRVMKILKYEDRYNDEGWKKGCELLKDSYRNVDTKPYLEFEKKDEQGNWQPINLNFSSYFYKTEQENAPDLVDA